MVTNKQLKKAHDYDFLKTVNPKKFVPVKGYDFSEKFDFNNFMKAYATTGYQATNLAIAIDLIKKMREEKLTIFLSYTSNIITSGLRDIIAYLVKNKFVHVICTTAGGIEEDILKTFKPFILGDFEADSKKLYVRGMNRTGNIYAPDDRYMAFEKFLLPILEDFYKRQINENKVVDTTELIREIGLRTKNEDSVLYWTARNNIPVFCPTIADGAIGDIVWFFKNNHKEFLLDIATDIYKINNLAVEAENTGGIVIGDGLSRHYLLNANIFRGGLKYAVFISSGKGWDGSSSAPPSEPYTWGKIKLFKPFEKNSVEVVGDATIIFPFVVAGTFLD